MIILRLALTFSYLLRVSDSGPMIGTLCPVVGIVFYRLYTVIGKERHLSLGVWHSPDKNRKFGDTSTTVRSAPPWKSTVPVNVPQKKKNLSKFLLDILKNRNTSPALLHTFWMTYSYLLWWRRGYFVFEMAISWYSGSDSCKHFPNKSFGGFKSVQRSCQRKKELWIKEFILFWIGFCTPAGRLQTSEPIVI